MDKTPCKTEHIFREISDFKCNECQFNFYYDYGGRHDVASLATGLEKLQLQQAA